MSTKVGKNLSHSELGKILGVSRQAITKACKDPGAPSMNDPDAWRIFMASRPGNHNAIHKDVQKSLSEAKLRKAKTDAERAEIDLGVVKGQLVEKSRVYAILERNLARVRAMLDSYFRSEGPAKQGGLPADKIAEMNGKRLDEIYGELSKAI